MHRYAICIFIFTFCPFLQAARAFLAPDFAVPRPTNLVCATSGAGNRISIIDTVNGDAVKTIGLPHLPSGVAFDSAKNLSFVTCADAQSRIYIVDPNKGAVISEFNVGPFATAPVVSSERGEIYVCYPFSGQIGVFDAHSGKEKSRIKVQNEPVAADLTKDGRFLLVAHQLPIGRADLESVGGMVSVIDLSQRKVTKEILLPSGSGSLKDLKIAADGQFAVVGLRELPSLNKLG